MKHSSIRQMLYDLNLKIKFAKKYYELLDASYDVRRELKEKLKSYPELLELYIKAVNADELFRSEMSDTYFVEGVKLGMRHAFEAVYEIEE